MRDRARDVIPQELGLRSHLDISRDPDRQVEAERWTRLVRQLVRDERDTSVIPPSGYRLVEKDDALSES
jgi:type IV secretory pathway VirD2 relaxase